MPQCLDKRSYWGDFWNVIEKVTTVIRVWQKGSVFPQRYSYASGFKFRTQSNLPPLPRQRKQPPLAGGLLRQQLPACRRCGKAAQRLHNAENIQAALLLPGHGGLTTVPLPLTCSGNIPLQSKAVLPCLRRHDRRNFAAILECFYLPQDPIAALQPLQHHGAIDPPLPCCTR